MKEGFGMKPGMDYVKEAWPIVKGDLVNWAILTVVGGILCYAAGLGVPGLLRAARKARKGEKPEIGDLFWGFKNNPVQHIIAVIGSSIGMVAFGIGHLYTGPKLLYALHMMAHEDEKEAVVALKASWAKTGDFMDHLIRYLTIGIVGGIGSVACGVGALVTGPIALIAFDAAYEDFKKLEGGEKK